MARRRAGGHAVARQGGGGLGPILARALSSPRFVGEPLLEDCYEDKARMRVGAHDSADHQPVSKLQQALVDRHFDLGTTGPAGNGVDGGYGPKTAAAVKAFKAQEHLGSEQIGDVGPGTMHRLDELFPAPGPAPTPPPPTPPTPRPLTPDDQKQKDAMDDRRKQLRAVDAKLLAMIAVAQASAMWQPGEGPPPPPVSSAFPREACVVKFFLHADPTATDYVDTLAKARGLVAKDLSSPVQPLTFRSKTAGFCDPGPKQNFAATCAPGVCTPLGTQLCDPTWYDASRHCRSDVLIHETYHWLGLPNDGKDFPAESKPADAFQNADTMTQFGNALMGLEIDNCVATDRKSTGFPAALASCLAAPAPAPAPPPAPVPTHAVRANARLRHL